jgi:uncharacterized protein
MTGAYHTTFGTSTRWLAVWLAVLVALLAVPALALSFPPLSGRLVDNANILTPQTEAALNTRLAALEQQSRHQLVVATIADLQGNDIADYGYQLGRAWGIGGREANDGVLLIIAPNDRKVRIEVGYGLEATLTDALTAQIIRDQITPKFREGDFNGGVTAGVEAIARQIELPPEQARAVAAAAQSAQTSQADDGAFGGIIIVFIFFAIIFIIFASQRRGGRRYGSGPIIVWGGDSGHSNWGNGGGGFSSSDFGGGGFSGGGGSFGGGGSSGSW